MRYLRSAVRSAFAAAFIALTLSTVSARAQTVLISNLTQMAAGVTQYTTTSDLFAQSFTPASSINQFLYAKLYLSLQDTSVSSSDIVHLYLYSNGSGTALNGANINSNQPVTQLADFGTVTVNSTTDAIYTFSSASRIRLFGNNIYWLVASDDNSNVGWDYTASATTTGTASINANASSGSSPDSGMTWSILPLADGPQRFEVGTASVAEPCSLCLIIIVAMGNASAGRRKYVAKFLGTVHSKRIC